MNVSEQPFRVLPAVTDDNEHFWRGGEHGELRFLRCADCGTWIHPPQPRCPSCWSTDVAPQASSGRGRILTYTINRQPWYPGLDPPYVVAIVELDDQEGLRLTTNIVNVDPDDVDFDQRVRVTFEEYPDRNGSVWLPFFEPDPGVGDVPAQEVS